MSESVKKIGIIGAMDIEVNALKAVLKPMEGESEVRVTELCSRTFMEGILDGVPVVVVQCGVGKVNAALVVQVLALKFGVTHIINTGIAGGMEKSLKIQDFVVSTNARYHDFDVVGFGYKFGQVPGLDCYDVKADEKLIDAAEKAFAALGDTEHKMIKGRVASGDQFIASKEVKETIRKNVDPACVEMEGAAIAHASYLNHIPFVVIRCMSDMADDTVEATYNFNEESAAVACSSLVRKMVNLI